MSQGWLENSHPWNCSRTWSKNLSVLMRVYIEHINWPVFSACFEFLICDCSSLHAQPFPGPTGGSIEHRGAGSYRRPTVAERQQLQRSCHVRGASPCAAQNDACKSAFLCLCVCWGFYKLNPCITVFLLLFRRVKNDSDFRVCSALSYYCVVGHIVPKGVRLSCFLLHLFSYSRGEIFWDCLVIPSESTILLQPRC